VVRITADPGMDLWSAWPCLRSFFWNVAITLGHLASENDDPMRSRWQMMNSMVRKLPADMSNFRCRQGEPGDDGGC
jgi:hypothetical protein